MASTKMGPVTIVPGTNKDNSNALQFGKSGSDLTNPTINLKIVGANNAANANIPTITNASMGQATTITIPDPGQSSATFLLSNSATTPTINGNYVATEPSSSAASAPGMYVRVINATATALATAGKVTVQAHTSATSQFAIYSMRVIKSTGLSGGGGDRLLALTDGTLVFNGTGVTAALLGTPITTRPAGTGNPDCGTAVDPTASTAGADIYLQYTGGTTDFTTGTVRIEVVLAQVTA